MSEAAVKSPGLYLRALEAEAPAVSQTALTAFVGVAERGPLDSPQLLGSFGDFLTVFGDIWPYGALGESVYAFFLNGGEKACVVRVGRRSAPGDAGEALTPATAAAPVVDANGAETLRLTARSPGRWGNALTARCAADATRVMDLARLTAMAADGATQIAVDAVCDFRAGGIIRLVHRTNLFIRSEHRVTAIDAAGLLLTLAPPLAQAMPNGSTVAGPGFRLDVSDGARREVFNQLSMNPAHARHFEDVIKGAAGAPFLDLARDGHSILVTATQVLGADGKPQGKPIDSTQPTAFTGGGDGVTFASATLPSADGRAAGSLSVTARARGRAGSGVRVRAEAFAGRLALPVPEAPGGATSRLVLDDIRGWANGDTLTITHAIVPAVRETAIIGDVDPELHAITIVGALANAYPIGSRCSVAGRFNLFVDPPGDDPSPGDAFFNLAMEVGPRFVGQVVNAPGDDGSRLVSVAPVDSSDTTARPAGAVVLSGGSDPDEVPIEALTGYDAGGALATADTEPGAALGLATLAAVPAVNLVAVPDIVLRRDLDADDRAEAQTRVLYHCQQMGERFALLDVPAALPPADALEWPRRFVDPRLARFGALYYPWLSMAIAGANRLVPPSGAVAGAIARTDRAAGVGVAPANVQLKGVVGLERELDADDQGELNVGGVNCVRKFEVGAIRLWGARTLSGEDQHRYVHNRRVLLLAIKALSTGLRWAVFEPNDVALRRRVRDSIDGFLRGMLATGLTAGNRPSEAFYVKVDDELNTVDTVASGQLLAEVGIAVSAPAEFVVITVKRRPDILTLVEEEA